MEITKRFFAGSEHKIELGLENAPADRRLVVETVRNPATKAVTAKAALAKDEITIDSIGTESANRTNHTVYGKLSKQNM